MKKLITILFLAIGLCASAQNEWFAPSVFYETTSFKDTVYLISNTGDTTAITSDSIFTYITRGQARLGLKDNAIGIGNISTNGYAAVASEAAVYFQQQDKDTIALTFTDGPGNADTCHISTTGNVAFWQFNPPLSNLSSNTTWSLTGNAGTTAGSNFIGTTDSKDLYFKTKNTTAIVVDTNQNVGIGLINAQAKFDALGTFHARHNGSSDSSLFMLGKKFIGLVPMDGLYTNKIDSRAGYIGYFDPSGFGANKNLGVVLYNNATSRANGLTVTKDQFNAVYWDSTGNWQFGTTGSGVDKHADLFSFYRPFGIEKSSFVSTSTTSGIRDYYRFDSLSNLKYTMILSHSTGISMGTGTGDNYNVSNLALHMDTNANVGIGTATPQYKLDVIGTIRMQADSIDVYADIIPGGQDTTYNLGSESFRFKNLYTKGIMLTGVDSATVYALTPSKGAIYYCTDCTGDGITGRIVTYIGAMWRRLAFE